MIILIAISVSLLVIVAGMLLLAKTQKEQLGKLFSFVSYTIVIVGIITLLFAFCGGFFKLMCSSSYKSSCQQAYCGASYSGCSYSKRSCSKYQTCGKRQHCESYGKCCKKQSCSKGYSCSHEGKSCKKKKCVKKESTEKTLKGEEDTKEEVTVVEEG